MVQNSSHFTRGRTVNACADLSTMPPAKCGLKANNPHMSEIPENSAFCCKNFTGQTSSPATHIDQSEFSWGLLSPFWRWGILPVSLYLSLSLCVSISLSLSLCLYLYLSLCLVFGPQNVWGNLQNNCGSTNQTLDLQTKEQQAITPASLSEISHIKRKCTKTSKPLKLATKILRLSIPIAMCYEQTSHLKQVDK